MVIDLKGKVALVTGSSRGIGKAIARALAGRGASVIVNCQRSELELRRTTEEMRADGADVLPLRADVSQEDEVRRLFQAIREHYGVLHYLVNNAGRAVDRPILGMAAEDFRAVLHSHVLAAFLCSQAAYPLMPHGGAILNIGAASANTGRRNGANYCAAKAAVMALTKCLAIEFAPRVQVNCLVPGWTETEDVVQRFQLSDEERRRRLESGILLGRLAEPEEIAEWALFLLTAPYATGQLFYVNGGSYLG